jgi:signal transduction histidine kinase
VIGAVVLATGLLLTLAGVAAGRIPGGAWASPGIARSPRSFIASPIQPATWYANGAILVGFFIGAIAFALIFALASSGLSVLLAGVGVVLIAGAIEGSRLLARIERWRAFVGEPSRPAAHAYKPLRGGIVDLLRAEFLDENRWRDVLYAGINFPLVTLELVIVLAAWLLALVTLTMPIWYDLEGAATATVLGPLAGHDVATVALRTLAGLALVPIAASASQLAMVLHRGLVSNLLCTSESRELRRQVEDLRQSRSEVLVVEANELARIERDLHDGAQQRLVALTMDLGLASERIDADPAAAKELILEGQAQAREALSELRSLVRGIAPSILLDRGLVAALESISARGPVPTTIASELAPGERLPAITERTAYFVATEALANVAKHSGATGCEVRIRKEWARLVIEVQDDGAGGARIEPEGGLAGLARRVAGVDGVFSVSSPPGGPTVVRAELPIAAG